MARPAGSALPDIRGGRVVAVALPRLELKEQDDYKLALAFDHDRHLTGWLTLIDEKRGETRGAPAFSRGETKSARAYVRNAFETVSFEGHDRRRESLLRLRARFRRVPAVRPDGARGFYARRRRRPSNAPTPRSCRCRPLAEDAQTFRPGVLQYQRLAETRADPVHVAHTARR